MPEVEKGDFLLNLYSEKIRSFLLYLDKANKCYEIEDIHQLRVSTKRINAIYQLIESSTDLNFDAKSHLKPTRNIFKCAGKIREGQVNLQLVQEYKLHSDPLMIYNIFLEKSQVKNIKKLNKFISDFNKIDFDHTAGMIEKYCMQINKEELLIKMDKYIQLKAMSVKKNLHKKQNSKNMHKIRMNLKAIDPILSLVEKTRPQMYKSGSLESLKETAIYIGNWHDRVILTRSIKKLLKNQKDKNKGQKKAFLQLIDLIRKDINDLLDKIYTNLEKTLEFIIH